ncbi:MAG: MBL fold metallo-hydrolase [Hungatella sp.]|nr:MBL fold metallo-hydrolase [Hungatella sp.]
MKLMFIGADHEVTGSCHYIECGDTKLVVDYGMEQGVNRYENAELPVDCGDLDYVLLTHAHIDHAGCIPLLYARGFRGQIVTTHATGDLCQIMLRDSAHIQEMEAEWKNRKARRAGQPEVVPLYTMEDAQGALSHLTTFDYGEIIKLNDDITVRFTDAGHLLGSASIEVWCHEGDVEKKIVFSGDIGNTNKPLTKDPDYIEEADYVVMECTYGNREHDAVMGHIDDLARIIQTTLDRGGNVVIPAFAVGRTQELLYFIRKIKEEHMIFGHEGFEVYVDSPLAVEATNVFKKNLLQCFDDETRELVKQGINPLEFPGLKLSVTSEDSKAINFTPNAKVIISASGMCDAGRIRHHLKHNLWYPESTIVFAGYQAETTLGRSLIDGAKTVKLFGETIDVRARIEMIQGLSSHADVNGLLKWIRSYKKKPDMVFAVHGDDAVCDVFAERLTKEMGLTAAAPFSGSVFDLATGQWITRTEGVPVAKVTAARKRADSVFARLVAAGERLARVILHNEGGTNKDLARFADQINLLCDKWDR